MSNESVAQSNVDVIETCLSASPEDHAWECEEERLLVEGYGERAACDLAAHDALNAAFFFMLFAESRLAYERARVRP